MKSVFETLNAINCQEHVEKKNGLSYLSWAWAWAEVKKAFPDANYTIYENGDGWNYFTDGSTCWVKTGVTIQGQEHIEYLPIMDFRNNSIPLDKVTSFDVNKSIQRSLTKACARHGLGLYIYAGEDLPEAEQESRPQSQPSAAVQTRRAAKRNTPMAAPAPIEAQIAYKPVDDETYWKIVACYAQGMKTKTGGDYRATWAQMTNAGLNEIARFDMDVDNYRVANGL